MEGITELLGLLVLGLFLGGLGLVLNKLIGHPTSSISRPLIKEPLATRITPTYRVRDDFLSHTETAFYHTLKAVVNERAVILTKVNLADLVYAAKGTNRERYIAWQRINRKHVDYVLCKPNSLEPIAAIELDDHSHQRPDRQERDVFVDEVLRGAGLLVFRFHPNMDDDVTTIRKTFARTLWPTTVIPVDSSESELTVGEIVTLPKTTSADSPLSEFVPVTRNAGIVCAVEAETLPEEIQPKEPAPEWALYADAAACESVVPEQSTEAEEEKMQVAVPLCPKCSSVMVKRVARQGDNKGGEFWGCPNYPRCRGVRQVE